MRITLIYHYFWPDEVISAQLFYQLAESLAADTGTTVSILTSNRSSTNWNVVLPATETREGMMIRRFWCPKPKIAGNFWRIGAGAILWTQWFWFLFFSLLQKRSQTIIFGTDPPMVFALVKVLRLVFRKAKFIHWCFDLYPEALVSANILSESSAIFRTIRAMTKSTYRSCSAVCPIGPFMQDRFTQTYSLPFTKVIVPWAIEEPVVIPMANPSIRKGLFSEGKVGFLYSGNLGLAHSYLPMLAFANSSVESQFSFALAVSGQQVHKLVKDLAKFNNVKVVERVSAAEYQMRQASADVHVVTLDPNWVGIVVPSKFFASIATGKPVLYFGPENSDLAIWIQKFQIGWIANNHDQYEKIAAEILATVSSPCKLKDMTDRCRSVYFANFSRKLMVEEFKRLI